MMIRNIPNHTRNLAHVLTSKRNIKVEIKETKNIIIDTMYVFLISENPLSRPDILIKESTSD